MALRTADSNGWSLAPERRPSRTRRSGAGASATDALPARFLRDGVTVESTAIAQSPPARRGAAPPTLDLDLDCAPDERAVLAIRHPSGALTFHAAMEQVSARRTTRGRRATGRDGGSVARFRIPLQAEVAPTPGAPVRRGLASRLLKIIVVKIKEAVIDAAIRKTVEFAALGAETLWWKARHLQEGWFELDAPLIRAKKLRPANPAALGGNERALLFLHGTFSHALSSFGPLAGSPGDFFRAAGELYGNRIFAYNHFTLSRDPEENARKLLAALPSHPVTFDVVTHSRGGLVLRQLVERRDALGAIAGRFSLGHAVLVASPNAGTPLATAKRWEDTFGVLANLLEMFPDNPFTTAAEFVANGIVWLAGHVTQDLPGIASMDVNGERIAELQAPPGPGSGAYSALVANFHPSGSLLQRLVDAGIDSFFGGANDLVVPSEGGWQIDGPLGQAIPGDRIGCFGRGGNLYASGDSAVTHVNFFSQRDTVDFLLRALQREGQAIVPIDPGQLLPTRRLWRGAGTTAVDTGRPRRERAAPTGRASPAARGGDVTGGPADSGLSAAGTGRGELLDVSKPRSDVFHLMILHAQRNGGGQDIHVLAMYGSARVLDEYRTRNPEDAPREKEKRRGDKLEPGDRFQAIIAQHNSIRNSLAGVADKNGRVPDLPDEAKLRRFGEQLFDALIAGNVRRLYDVARSEPRSGPLNVIFTSTVPWLAEKPWEFAVDTSRHKYLVTEEIHFVRNVLTSVPAHHVPLRRGRLRLLVVAAQPIGAAELSTDEETAVIRRGFQSLIDDGLAEIDVLVRATPGDLHRQVQLRAYDIVHFIGHGEFDEKRNESALLFENADGGVHDVGIRALREILCGREIQLVFLNACESGRDSRGKRNVGAAQSLMEAGMPAVVANQYPVLDPSAVSFSEHFYWSLAHGSTLGEAAREARVALNYSLNGDVIDWAIPVVFARDPDYRLVAPMERPPAPRPSWQRHAEGPARATPGGARAAARGAGQRAGVTRVGVADLARMFPELGDTVAVINAAQDRFQFSTVDIVAPLGAWQIDSRDGRSPPIQYLNANRFAQKLRKQPRALGVDILMGITSWPMIYTDVDKETWYDIYCWWPDENIEGEKDLGVILFSVAGLAIHARGAMTNRILANTIVETLAGLYSNRDTHPGGKKDCPLYRNPERSVEVMQSSMRFCKPCRDRLDDVIPEALPALEAILGAFAG